MFVSKIIEIVISVTKTISLSGAMYVLTHLRQVDPSTTTLWTGLFQIAACLASSRGLVFTMFYVL